jgi:hypothetical protein
MTREEILLKFFENVQQETDLFEARIAELGSSRSEELAHVGEAFYDEIKILIFKANKELEKIRDESK